jgi:hypothetical protein
MYELLGQESMVPDIEVVQAEAVFDAFGRPQIALDLRNNSDKAIVYLYIESHTCRDGMARAGDKMQVGR